MTLSKVSEAVRKGVVARIVAKRSTAALEAKKYGVRPALVRGWVHEEKVKLKEGGSVPPKTGTTPPPTPSDPTAHNPGVSSPSEAHSPAAADPNAAARARAAAGVTAPDAPGARPSVPSPGTDAEAALKVADEEDRKLVLDTYRSAKKGAVEILARRTELDPAHALVASAAEPSEIVKLVLGTNAGLIAPMIRGKLIGWPAIAGVLVFDAVVTMMAIRDVAAALGKAKPANKPPPPPPAPVAAPPAPARAA